jgi:hypothetical protein
MIRKSWASTNNFQAAGPVQHLDQRHLADRWLVSPRTLEQWRWQGRGPRFLKLGGRVVYPLNEVEAFETANLHANTVAPLPAISHWDESNGQR